MHVQNDERFVIPEMLGVIGHSIHEHIPGRQHKLSPTNRQMMVILQLRSYLCYAMLSLLFDVSVHAASAQINALIPILWKIYAPNIYWPTEESWRQLRYGSHSGKHYPQRQLQSTEAIMPLTDHRQSLENKYSEHRHRHCIHTKVIVDNRNHI